MVQVLLTERKEATNQKVFDILFDADEITWKDLILGLIDTEQMDPWDIDISIIAHKFLVMLKKLKDLDFRVSGKVVLASAVLLKLKSDKLMEEEIAALDQLINSVEQQDDAFLFDEVTGESIGRIELPEKPKLIPRTPQPRKRKVSVYDLIGALELALETEHARFLRPKADFKTPIIREHVDIGLVIKDVYSRINAYYTGAPQRKRLTFADIIPSEEKQDKVMTFIPLLHLDNQRKIDLLQEDHFGVIEIGLLEENADLDDLTVAAADAKS